jgi:adenine phosphoribosyltransferase
MAVLSENTKMEIAQDRTLASRVEAMIKIVPDFPRPNIRFRDISPILENDPSLFRAVIDQMAKRHRGNPPDCVVCIESWGYVFGAPLAYLLGSRICLARRPGKLPRKTIKQGYVMCYASDKLLEIHDGAIQAGETTLIVDDVIASGGSALATVDLVEKAGGKCVGITCLAAMADGPFTKQIEGKGIPIYAIAGL